VSKFLKVSSEEETREMIQSLKKCEAKREDDFSIAALRLFIDIVISSFASSKGVASYHFKLNLK